MMVFWLAAAALLVLASTLVLVPLLRQRKQQQLQRQDSNIQLTKERIAELREEHQQGLLTESELEQAIRELKIALVDEVATDVQPIQRKSSRGLAGLGFLLAVAVGLGAYWPVSEVGKIQHWYAVSENLDSLKNQLLQGEQLSPAQLQDISLSLRTRLAEQPNDAQGWHLLGRLYLPLQRPDMAVEAFEKALALNPNNVETLFSISQVQMLQGDEAQLRQAKRWLFRLLEIDPEQQRAYGMLALVAEQLGEQQLALTTWLELKGKVAPEEDLYSVIEQQLARLQGEQTAIQIQVELAAELADKLPASAFIFVFAQDAEGQVRMPAAVVKRQITELPVQVTLSDADAMMPNYRLSQLSKVRLVARVSQDENVELASGELYGESQLALSPGQRVNQTITINREKL